MQTFCCHKCCDKARQEAIEKLLFEAGLETIQFIVCPICGNKRCPKASDHDLDCTGSNEAGQPGSIYEKILVDIC